MFSLLQTIAEQSLLLFGVVFFLIGVTSLAIGYQSGLFILKRRIGVAEKEFGIVEGFVIGGMLALLGFFLGTALSTALDQHLSRQAAVVAEATSIESAWLVAGAQGVDEAAEIQRLLKDYTEVQISAITDMQAPEDELRYENRTDELRNEIWVIASKIVKQTRDDVSSLLLDKLSVVFENTASRNAAFDRRIPTHLLRVLVITTILTLIATGTYFGSMHGRLIVMPLVLLMMFTSSVMLITDISIPNVGTIEASPERLIRTLSQIQSAR